MVRDCVSHGFKDAPSLSGAPELQDLLTGMMGKWRLAQNCFFEGERRS